MRSVKYASYRDATMLYRNVNYSEAEQTGSACSNGQRSDLQRDLTRLSSPDGQIYGYINTNRQIMLYRVQDQSIVQTFAGHSGRIRPPR